jgi:hypothetical protein
MTTTTSILTAAQQIVYTRSRILSTLCNKGAETFGHLEPKDILSISLDDTEVICKVDDGNIILYRRDVLLNFWEHRTRTPSYFDYKVWRQVKRPRGQKGVAVGAIDYSDYPNKIAVDRDGIRKLYFVNELDRTCTCGAWAQLDEHRIELDKEFKRFNLCCFEATCKHVRWAEANTNLQTLKCIKSATQDEYNPRLCVYSFDHRRGLLLYRVTWDGVKAGGKWFPVDGWKEKAVYGKRGIPTGECWDTLLSALNQEEPFKLCPYSQSVGALMQSSRAKV